MEIIDKILEKGEYFEEKTEKNGIVIHFTAGGYNPLNTISGWDTDDVIDPNTKKKSARVVGTHFVIGGISNSNGDNSLDGKVYRAVPEDFWIHHLGTTYSNNRKLNQLTFGIEICNYGPVKLGNDGKYYNYVNNVMPKHSVVKLESPFKGYNYYHDLTDKQVESLKNLILYLHNKYPSIPLKTPLLNISGYDINNDAIKGLPGVYTHINYRKDKYDFPPIKKLIDMLKTICV